MLNAIKPKLSIFLALLVVIAPLFNSGVVEAAALSSRSVALATSEPDVITSHEFKFTIPGFTNLGSIQFEYCENSPLPAVTCDAPAGFSASAATLASQTGETGFSIAGGSPSNKIVLTRTASPSSAVPVAYTFDDITNPSGENKPVYVRISTYVTEDASGGETDFGAVVFSTAKNIAVSGYVPPYIIFCVGLTVELKCTSSVGNQLDFGELAANRTGALTSQYSGSTNDPGGYSTSTSGTTMTSGTNSITALGSAQPSQAGQSQFGLNLRDNSSPDVGTEPFGPGTSTAIGPVANANQFFFGNQVISNSNISTDFKRFTVSYIVNVPQGQTAGVYSTTVTYIAVAAF